MAVNINGAAYCEIGHHTWASPISDYTGQPCDTSRGDLEFILRPGQVAKVGCYQGSSSLDRPRVETLGYGQSRSMETVTCESERTGITCTDNSTGHFFRLSSEFYELG
jgi:hypothetical protein